MTFCNNLLLPLFLYTSHQRYTKVMQVHISRIGKSIQQQKMPKYNLIDFQKATTHRICICVLISISLTPIGLSQVSPFYSEAVTLSCHLNIRKKFMLQLLWLSNCSGLSALCSCARLVCTSYLQLLFYLPYSDFNQISCSSTVL